VRVIIWSGWLVSIGALVPHLARIRVDVALSAPVVHAGVVGTCPVMRLNIRAIFPVIAVNLNLGQGERSGA